MAITKEAYSRYLAIDNCLRRKQGATLQKLIEFVSDKLARPIAERTIQQDLQMMRYDQSLGFEAPIVFDRTRKVYLYSDENYSIQRMPVSADDLNGIDFAISLLNQFKQIPIIKEFEDAIQKIAASVQLNREALGEENYFYFNTNNSYKGIEFIEKIGKAIRQKNSIEISYQSFQQNKAKTHLIDPLFIREYKGRFYLIGNSNAKNTSKTLTFSFDRLKEVTLTDLTFEAQQIDKKEFYENTFGVTVTDQKPEEVELFFNAIQANYILSQPMHSSQKVLKQTKEGVTIALKTQINKELVMQLLSYGAGVKVKKPASLKREIKEELKKAIDQY